MLLVAVRPQPKRTGSDFDWLDKKKHTNITTIYNTHTQQHQQLQLQEPNTDNHTLQLHPTRPLQVHSHESQLTCAICFVVLLTVTASLRSHCLRAIFMFHFAPPLPTLPLHDISNTLTQAHLLLPFSPPSPPSPAPHPCTPACLLPDCILYVA